VTRHVSAVVVVFCLFATSAVAQTPNPPPNPQFTVSVQSAAVRKAPSTGSPIVGQAARGAVLEVTRDIGAWVKVTWPEAPEGFGYVHQSMGTMSERLTMEERVAAAFEPTPAVQPAVEPAAAVAPAVAPADAQLARTLYVPPPTHLVGLGGQFTGATPGVGFTSRIWSRNRLGVQLDLSRSRMTTSTSPERLESTTFAPSVVYALADHVSDSVWLRPYVGGGGAFVKSSLKSGTPEVTTPVTDSRFTWRTFGGLEVTLPNVPRFAISADAGYEWSKQPFPGFEVGGPGFSVAGHWYVK
jgi:opacity protein-like surface antigen